jgi:hypothetical protein
VKERQHAMYQAGSATSDHRDPKSGSRAQML